VEIRIRLRQWLAIAALSTSAAFIQPAVASAPTSDSGVEQVLAQKAAEYRQVLATFDVAMHSAPDEVAIAVERCRFISQFTDDEYGEWIESAPDDFAACQETLKSRWKSAPAAQLFALQQLWGKDAIEQGEALLKGAGDWPSTLRRDLLAKVSQAQEKEDADRAGELAVQAVRLGDASRVARAVRHLQSHKEFTEAARLLAAAPPATDAWTARARVESALELPDQQAALKELQRYADAEWKIATVVAARAYLHAGDIASARKLLKDEDGDGEPLQKVRFDVAMAAGNTTDAAATVRFTDTEHFSENLQRFMTVATAAPSALLQGPMLLGVLLVFVLVLVLGLFPGLLLVPVHYRGLIRTVRGRPAVPLLEGVSLRRAWWAAAVFMVVPSMVAMVGDPGMIPSLLDGAVPSGPGAFRMMLWGALVGLLCLLPVLRQIGVRQLVGGHAALRASFWRVPVAWACLIGTGMLIAAWHVHFGGGGDTLQTKAIDALASGGRQAYGLLPTLLLVAVLVPVFEEIVFRGLLLGGLTRHISFGWANTLQAVLFAFVHDDPPRFIFYLTMGLLGGWLVKRTKALGPAVALHALNNTLAFALLTMRG
jgi:uncharacterized protein